MKRHLLPLLALLALVACDEGPPRAPEPVAPGALSEEYVWRFLVQHECEGAALPVEEACGASRPARAGALSYRRIDWSGVQAIDAVLREDGAILHVIDFGDGERAFGRLDRGRGDGGDLARITAWGVGYEQTEDGGAGRQWWRDQRCAAGAGWLLFDREAGDQWQSRDTTLGLGRSEGECPAQTAVVHTRWRRVSFTLPWTDGGPVRETRRDSIVVDHFSGGPPEVADHMERFVFSAGLGKTVWERWEHAERTRRDRAEVTRDVGITATDGRCPIGADAPGPEWVRADCRVWTRFVRGPSASLAWP